MPETLEQFAKRALEEILNDLPPEELRKHLSPEERVKGLSPEERVKGLSPEELLEGLSRSSSTRLAKSPVRPAALAPTAEVAAATSAMVSAWGVVRPPARNASVGTGSPG